VTHTPETSPHAPDEDPEPPDNAERLTRLADGYKARLDTVKARLDGYHQDVWNRRAATEGCRDTASWIRAAARFLAGDYDKTYPGPAKQHRTLQDFREYWAADSLRDALRCLVWAERDTGLRSQESARLHDPRRQPEGGTLADLLAALEAEAEHTGAEDIDAALAPLTAAREDLADRIGTLAAIGLARLIRRELPRAAYADFAWTADGDAAYLEPAGRFYDAAGTEIPVPDRITLETHLLQYSRLLDKTNTAAWFHLVTSHDANGGESTRRLDIAAALAQSLPKNTLVTAGHAGSGHLAGPTRPDAERLEADIRTPRGLLAESRAREAARVTRARREQAPAPEP
jgi:hypothetical protein